VEPDPVEMAERYGARTVPTGAIILGSRPIGGDYFFGVVVVSGAVV
jgi:hypothetical protein